MIAFDGKNLTLREDAVPIDVRCRRLLWTLAVVHPGCLSVRMIRHLSIVSWLRESFAALEIENGIVLVGYWSRLNGYRLTVPVTLVGDGADLRCLGAYHPSVARGVPHRAEWLAKRRPWTEDAASADVVR